MHSKALVINNVEKAIEVIFTEACNIIPLMLNTISEFHEPQIES